MEERTGRSAGCREWIAELQAALEQAGAREQRLHATDGELRVRTEMTERTT